MISCGHGAGRKCAANQTAGKFTFMEFAEWCKDNKVMVNRAPGVLGDHPDGYKDVNEIIPYIPQSQFGFQLKTLVTFKEGLAYRGKCVAKFLEYLVELFKPNIQIYIMYI